MVTADQIKELRGKTGVSVMQCKKALEEALGDIEKAVILLRKLSGNIADKKADRYTPAGAVVSYIHGNNSVGAMVLLSTETDFVAKNDEFKKLGYDIAMHVAAQAPAYVRREDIPEDEMKKIQETLAGEIPAGKPKDVQEKILDGKIGDYLKTRVLLEQPFIKDEAQTIGDIVKSATQKFGERVAVSKFARFTSAG